MSSAKTSAYETGGHCRDGRGGEIIKMGYLRKLKVCNLLHCKDLNKFVSFFNLTKVRLPYICHEGIQRKKRYSSTQP
jgi:hypothetical protein